MLRGELAVAALVLITVAMLIDVAMGNARSFFVWLQVVAWSVLLTLGIAIIKFVWQAIFSSAKGKGDG